MSAYLCCCLYRALKLHFTTDYDFTKYHGKVKYSVDQFHKNKHKYVYEKLSKKYSDEEVKLEKEKNDKLLEEAKNLAEKNSQNRQF